MRKIHLLMPTILVASSIPMVSMVGCGKSNVIHVTDVKIEQDSIESWMGDTPLKKVDYKVLPENATDKSVNWTVVDTSKATISADGTITPIAEGETTIIVTTHDGGKTDTCSLKVKKHKKISIVQGDTIAYIGHPRQLTCEITPEFINEQEVRWSSVDEGVATIDPSNGTITPIAEGETTIKAELVDEPGKYDQCKLKIYKEEPLCFEKDGTGENPTIGYSITGNLPNIHIKKSTDGTNWEDWDGNPISLSDDIQKLYVENTQEKLSVDNYNYFRFTTSGNGKIKMSGSVDSMINYSELTPYCYTNLFATDHYLTTAPNIPATSLAEGCYQSMFDYCPNLIQAPQSLPATKLTKNCYDCMFEGCYDLTSAPSLPATELAEECYDCMFMDCTALTQAPSLPATELAEGCYECMFSDCESLTQAPSLPATALADSCYFELFYGCTSLALAPELPATTLAEGCYDDMFHGCTSLTSVPSLPATELANDCYNTMFYGCTSLKIKKDWFVKNIFNKTKISFAKGWAGGMFGGGACANVEPFDLPDSQYTLKPYCFSGLNANLNIERVPENYLPWTELTEGCYELMFQGCKNLFTSPNLPATGLAKDCYKMMFRDCSSLAEVLEFPSVELAEGCCQLMFQSCSSLHITDVAGEQAYKFFTCPGTIPTNAVTDMFYGTGGEFKGTPQANHSYYWYT